MTHILLFAAALLSPNRPVSSYFDREVAARGTLLPAEHVWEPAACVTGNWIVLAHNVKYRILTERRTGWRIYDRTTGSWSGEAFVEERGSPPTGNSIDASLASADSEKVVMTALAKEQITGGTEDRVVVSRLSLTGYTGGSLTPVFSRWERTADLGAHD